MYDKKRESISHIVSECEKLAQKEYKRRHEMCGKQNLKSEKWYENAPEGDAKNEEVKILWDAMIQYDREIKVRKQIFLE